MTDQIKVVYADDEGMLRDLLGMALPMYVKSGSQFFEGKNGNDLVRLVEEHNPQVIVTDNDMPGMNGVEAVKYLRDKGNLTNILVTSGNPQKVMDGLAGVHNVHYLNKPYQLDELKNKVREIWPEYSKNGD